MIRSKLGSRSGSAILISLIALLVAALVSAVVINAAVGNMFRIEGNKRAEQAYLTASSAARLISGVLKGDKVTFDKVWMTQQNYTRLSPEAPWEKGSEVPYGDEEVINMTYVDSGSANPFSDLLVGWMGEDPYGSDPHTSTINISLGGAISLDDVTVQLSMGPREELGGSYTYKYNIQALVDLAPSAADRYKLKLAANTVLMGPQPNGPLNISEEGPFVVGPTASYTLITYTQPYVVEFPDMVVTKGF